MDSAQWALLILFAAAWCILTPYMTFIVLRWLWRQISK